MSRTTKGRRTTTKTKDGEPKRTGSRGSRRATAKTDKPVLAIVKDTPKPAPDQATVIADRPKLPNGIVRRKLFTGPMGPSEQAATRAALASAAIRLPIPVRAWKGSQAQPADGLLLIHNPGPDRTFTAHIACTHGAIHSHPILTAQDLAAARAITRTCERRHTPNTPAEHGAELDWDKAIHHGITRTHRVADGITATRKTTADTQKEHPQP